MTEEPSFTTLIVLAVFYILRDRRCIEIKDKPEVEKFQNEVKAGEGEEKETKRVTPRIILKEFASWTMVLVAAFLLAYVVTNYVIIKTIVISESMESTIMVKDKIIGNRIAYLFSEPERGDIIIFKYPDNEEENYVKRIIGLPGERIVIKAGKVYIDGSEQLLEEPYLNEPVNEEDFGPYEVPENCYFVMGDNRNNSKDARYWTNTYVPKKKIIGKVWFRYSPSIGWIK